VWALGTMLWEIFTEKKPWEDTSTREVNGMKGLENLRDMIVSKGQRLPNVPDNCLPTGHRQALRALIDGCLEQSVAKRPSMKEVFEGLSQVLEKIKGGAPDGGAVKSDLETRFISLPSQTPSALNPKP
jgi:serine/threonine protein kinase